MRAYYVRRVRDSIYSNLKWGVYINHLTFLGVSLQCISYRYCTVYSAYSVYLYMIRNSVRRIKVDASKYVNIDTGETLNSEHGDVVHLSSLNLGHKILRSEKFCIVDLHALERVKWNVSDSDFGKLTKMLEFVHGDLNILCDKNGYPFTKADVMKLTGLARNSFSLFLKKMKKIGVIYIVDGYKGRRAIQYIMINPTLARTRNSISKECLRVFEDLSRK